MRQRIGSAIRLLIVILFITQLTLVWGANGRLQARAAATDNRVDSGSTFIYYFPIIKSDLALIDVWIEDNGAWTLSSIGDSLEETREPANYDNVRVSSSFSATSFNRPPFSGQPVWSMARSYYFFDLSSLPQEEIVFLSLNVMGQINPGALPMTIYIHEGAWNTGFQKENWFEYGDLLATYQFVTDPGDGETSIQLPSFVGQARPDFIKLVIRVDEMTAYPYAETSPSFSAIVRPNEHLGIPPEYRARLVVGFLPSGVEE